MSSLITAALSGLLNVEFGPERHVIEAGMVRKLTEAVGDPNPKWSGAAPPSIYAALRIEELTQAILTADCPASRVLNGGNELELYQPMRIGDTISVTGKLINLYEREGKRGKMLFTVSELIYTNGAGKLVGKRRNTLIRY